MKKAISQSLFTLILNGISILSLIFLVFSLFSYGRANNELNEANEERYNLTYNANRFMNGSSYLTNEHYDNYWDEVNNLKNRDKGVAAMQEIGITSAEQTMIDDMYALSNQLVPLEEEAMENVLDGKRSVAIDYVYGEEYSDAITKINALKEQFLNDLDTRTLAQIDNLIQQTNMIRIEMIIAFVVVAVMQLFNMLYIRAKVLRPVRIVKDQMLEISKGNLSAAFGLGSDTSEIGRLVDSIHETKRELKKYIKDGAYVISLAIQGKQFSSEEFSKKIHALGLHRESHIIFIIGGSIGLASDILKESKELISFSKMTFPHQLMRIVLLEQIYRGYRIMNGEPYHK